MGWRDFFSRKVAVGGGLGSASLPAGPTQLPVRPPHLHETAADALDFFCAKHNCKYEILHTPTERVVRLHFYHEGIPQPLMTLAGRGPRVPAAVADVMAQAKRILAQEAA